MKKINNILKISLFAIIALIFNACSDDDSPTVYPEISGIENEVTLIANEMNSYELAGGDGTYKVQIENTDVATVNLDGKTLKIIANGNESSTTLKITSASQTKKVKVIVKATPEVGVYKNNELATSLPNFVQNNTGLWMLEKAGNPYDGKGVFIANLPTNLQKGTSAQVTIKAFGINDITNGTQSAEVEIVTPEVVKLKVGGLSIIVPQN